MGERRTSCPLPRNSRLSGVAALGSLVLLLAVVLGGANIGTLFNLKSPRAGTTSMVIPFFGSHGDDDDDKSTRWSQLNHRVEEYRQDLVKVVESLDIIIDSLETTAARANKDGEMPGEGMRRLAGKMRRKLEKTPPRWQVNLDVLSWLLRPVPFVAGLPAPRLPNPTSTTFTSSTDDDDHVDNSNAPAARDRESARDGAVLVDAEEAAGATGKQTDETPVQDAIRERRAVPVPEQNFRGAGGGGADEGKDGTRSRAGFHSYDETHQVFTHILRDWTSEGDSVRAAVYDPLLRALDVYVGWQRAADARTVAQDGSSSIGGFRERDDATGSAMPGEGCDQLGPGVPNRRMANVLVPGAGLGRLAVEIAARDYASVHANELSVIMLSSCYWLLEALRGAYFTGTTCARVSEQECGECSPPAASHRSPDSEKEGGGTDGEEAGEDFWKNGASSEETEAGKGFFEFYPFLNDAALNEVDGEARFRSVRFPDPAGRAVLARASGRLSFQAGEFSSTYGGVGGAYEGMFDAVVTSFFVDTAPNVVQYVATTRRVLRPGGVWINCGPLHWHNHSALALSLDEILLLVAGSGFRLEVVEQLPPSDYRVQGGGGSLRVEEFRPIFWVAILDGGPA